MNAFLHYTCIHRMETESQERLQKLTEKLEASQKKTRTLKQEKEQLLTEADKMNRKITENNTKIIQLEASLEEYYGQLEIMETEKLSNDEKLQSCKDCLERMGEKATNVMTNVNKIEEDMKARTQGFECRFQALSEQLQKYGLVVTRMRQRKETVEEEEVKLKKAQEQTNAAAAVANEENERLKGEAKRLKDINQTLNENEKQLKESIATLKEVKIIATYISILTINRK